jgi:long-subunit acyl-CoA synthetase (AMP-forming)
MINAAGKSMSPANIEAILKVSGDLVGQVCCVGDARPFNVALITLDPETSAAFAARNAIADATLPALASHQAVHAKIAAAVERANQRLARVEQIRRFTILPSTGHLSATSSRPP